MLSCALPNILLVLVLIVLLIITFVKLTLGRCKSPVCLIGKTALITGGAGGIGYETALQLAGRGCRVIIADIKDCEKAKENIIKETNNPNIVAKELNLSSLSSVRQFAKDINETEERLDILINNAGVASRGWQSASYTREELTMLKCKVMRVNHFGHFLLTHLLLDLLKKSAPSRIIFVSSVAAYISNLTTSNINIPPSPTFLFSSPLMEYSNSKLCNVIAMKKFAKHLEGTGVTCNALHPGLVSTKIWKNIPTYKYLSPFLNLFYKSSAEGAETSIHLAIAKEVENVTGKYFMDCIPVWSPRKARDEKFAEEIWKQSETIVALSEDEKLS